MPVNLCLIGITGFVDSIMGDVLDEASYALMEALSDFFPKAQSRLIKEILRLVKGHAEENSRRITEIIEGGGLAQAIQSGNSLPNAQESSAAIQTE